ncbi:MAG: 30S ribosomal protein S2 [Fervidicoccaceae archaeon]|jgi:small subunit ribosomal protein S2|uniref:Small ribosomal subunit protein uS2 n=1 Tax=Fervidicoccus fontis TaxID=683846 RepID=A0A7C2UVV5_9CREN|nr:MAG: 30S ribosomal protein S2 [Fervidicoccus sp.]HEU97524.1 30S ribosomal protein S2 [Fervidicoccus fontis]
MSNEESKMKSEIESHALELLVPIDQYLAAGVHIGTYVCNKAMREFVYRIRPDGLYVLDVRKIDERLRIASKMIARYEPEKVLVVSVRQYGHQSVKKFSQYTRAKSITGRVIPGVLTNPRLEYYMEPELVLVTDPRADQQIITEAFRIGVPVVSFSDTDNRIDGIDLIIPANNKGRRSLALLYWILTRQVLRERGELAQNADLPESPDAFETKIGGKT